MTMWLTWAIILVAQNFSFTFVSRARNSGSIRRHIIAALLSNGVWFVSQALIFSQLYKIMTGEYGIMAAVGTGLFYTAFTILGSAVAHWVALHTESGMTSVGASKKTKQLTVEEYERLIKLL